MVRNTVFFALAMFIAAIAAFWPVYFIRLGEVPWPIHAHTITSTAWLALLVNQAWWARQDRFKRHRLTGKLAWLLWPTTTIGGFLVLYSMLQGASPLTAEHGKALAAYDLAAVLWFAGAAGLALTVYRKTWQVHARLMISTLPFLIMPVLSRLILFYVPVEAPFEAGISSTIAVAELVTLWLIWNDRRTGQIYPVYPALLAGLAIGHLGFHFADGWSAWIALTDWYAAL